MNNIAHNKICYVVTIGKTIRAFFIEQLLFLAEKGFDISIICHDDCNLSEILPSNIHLYNINIPRGISLFGSILALIKLYSIFVRKSFDIVQYSTPNAGFIASMAAKWARVSIRNYHIMGYRFEGDKGLKRLFLKTLERMACNNSTDIECVCKSTLEKGIKSKLFSKDKAVVVGAGSTGGVNTTKFNYENKMKWRREIRTKYDLSDDDLLFGFVGRITADKGIRELLMAFSSVSQNIQRRIFLFLVGPSEDDSLVKNAEECSNIILTGVVYDVEKYFSAIDVLVLPSYREGFGNVLIEAQTMGCPCIASDIDGPRDAMKNDYSGILVNPKDAKALGDAMLQMISDEKRNSFAENALVFSKQFESRVLCENILTRKNNLLFKIGK